MNIIPQIQLGSTPLVVPHRTASGLCAVNALTIHWGRDSLIAETDPATLTFSILLDNVHDVLEQLTTGSIYTEEVRVLAGNTVIFCGQIVTANVVNVRGQWRLDVHAVDPTRQLAVRPARGGYGQANKTTTMRGVLADILEKMPRDVRELFGNFILPLDENDQFLNGFDNGGKSYLDCIRELFASYYRASYVFDPTTREIKPTPVMQINRRRKLQLDGATKLWKIIETAHTPSGPMEDAYVIDGARVEGADTLTFSAENRIGQVIVEYPDNQFNKVETIFLVPSTKNYLNNYDPLTWTTLRQGGETISGVPYVVDMLSTAQNYAPPPEVTFRPGTTFASVAELEFWITAYESGMPATLQNMPTLDAMVRAAPSRIPVVTATGGTIQFHGTTGWTITKKLAWIPTPTYGTSTNTPRWNGLSTSMTWMMIDRTVTWNDLTTVEA